jgi:ubiquitin-activating enzyme E1 C
MGKRSFEEIVSKEDSTMQDSAIHDIYDSNVDGLKEPTTGNNGDNPMRLDANEPLTPKLKVVIPARGSLSTLLNRSSTFANEDGTLPIGEFEPTVSSTTLLSKSKVLVVGAGGLGCELLKDLAMSGIKDVHVIDLDTIDVTNLNRQFLFRQKDVGSSKAEVAAAFINERNPWMNVTPHHNMIQDKDPSFYAGFNVILSGLDNVEARRWLNSTMVGLVDVDEEGDPLDPESIIPIIDGGTEGFAGQARVILPRVTSCFECSIDAFPPQRSFPLCTIAETPRKPEHCIAYASILLWPKEFPDKKLDKDSPDDMKWVFERALERASKYNIDGVTYMLTMGVVKNIIPAVASTNAIVSAVSVLEAVKILTFCSQTLNTYMMYMGSEGVYSHTFVYERKEDCPVSSYKVRTLTVLTTTTLNELLQQLTDSEGKFRLKAPSLTASANILYMQKPPALNAASRPNLDKALSELVDEGEEITVTDPILQHTHLSLAVRFKMTD